MSKLFDLLRGAKGEASVNSRIGLWRQFISNTVDQLRSDLDGLTFSQPYLTQTDWAVDSVNGNDNAAGTTAAPLLTLAELARRWNGRTFAPSVTAVTVALSGTFVGETLDLQAQFTAPNLDVPVTVSGQMTTLLSGLITTYQAFVVGATRASVTVGGADFSTLKQKRMRITTSATAAGAVSTICSNNGITVANVGQFSTVAGLTGTTVNPVNGDGFVVEGFVTQIKQCNVNCPGAQVTIRDLSIQAPAGGVSNNMSQQATNFLLKFFGCEFSTGTGIVTNIEGDCVVAACSVIGASQVQTVNCFQSWKNSVVLSTSPVAHSLGSSIQATSMVHDGDGVRNAGMNITNNSQVSDTTQRAFFGCINGGGLTCMARCGGGGAQWSLATFWGATGNTTTNACQIVNGSMAQYSTLPSATGATPGVNDVVIGGTGMAWGGLPFANAAPDNASFNIRH